MSAKYVKFWDYDRDALLGCPSYWIGSGPYAMSRWAGDDQVTYRVVHDGPVWMLRKTVAGAATLLPGIFEDTCARPRPSRTPTAPSMRQSQ